MTKISLVSSLTWSARLTASVASATISSTASKFSPSDSGFDSALGLAFEALAFALFDAFTAIFFPFPGRN